jgi:hypothetical protein
MSSQNEVHEEFETKDMRWENPEVNEAVKIEEILRRAKEIHRERGGVFGYDLNDWLQAWDELPRARAEANGGGSKGARRERPAKSQDAVHVESE